MKQVLSISWWRCGWNKSFMQTKNETIHFIGFISGIHKIYRMNENNNNVSSWWMQYIIPASQNTLKITNYFRQFKDFSENYAYMIHVSSNQLFLYTHTYKKNTWSSSSYHSLNFDDISGKIHLSIFFHMPNMDVLETG